MPAKPFVKGQPGGPGRPPGARSRLSETALAMLGADFAQHGAGVIERVRVSDPATYLKVVASLLPRQMMVTKHSPFSDLTDAELQAIEAFLVESRAKLVHEIAQLEQQSAVVVDEVEQSEVRTPLIPFDMPETGPK